MASHTITFDPTSGVAYGVNLVINTGATFKDSFTVKTTSGSAFNFNGWTGSSQIAKSVSIGSSYYASATLKVGFTSRDGGKFDVSLGSTETRSLSEGRYVYDILVSSGSTVYRIVSGNVLVVAGISSAPAGNSIGIVTSTPYSLPDGLISSGTQTTTTISETSIDSFSATDYRSAKYQIQITKGSEYQVTEIFIVHDGTNSYQTEYATVKTGTTLSTFSSDIDTGNVRLLVTPSSVDSTTFKIVRTLVEI